MATEEELNNQRDLNENKRETIELSQQELGLLESLRRSTQSRVDSENDILDYIRQTNNILNDQFKVSKNISVEKDLAKKISREILNINENLNTILQNELGSEKTSNDLSKTRQKLIKDQISLQTLLNTQFTEDAELNFEINKQLREQIGNIDKLLGKVKNVEEESEKIKNNFGVKSFAGLEKLTKEIPILRKFTEPLSKATEASRLQAVSNKFTADQRKALQEQIKGDKQRLDKLQKIAQAGGKGIEQGALKEFGFGNLAGISASLKARSLQKGVNADLAKNIKALNALPKAIKPLIAGLAMLAKTLTRALSGFVIFEFISALIKGDKLTGELAKNMNMTYSEANKTRMELMRMAAESGNNAITTKDLQETLIAMNQTLGTNVMMNKENLTFMTEMRKRAGLTHEEMKGIFQISNATGEFMEDITGEVMAQAKISSTRLGVVLNEKEVLNDINKISSATTLSLGKNPGLIADAVTTAKALGLELSKVDQIADGLLNLESSITSELEAEALLGRDINLNLARQAALSNDLTTLAKEISREMGSSADFAKMTRFEQNALAKSLNMNREELASSLFIGEQLRNVTGDTAEEQRLILQRRIDEVGLAQVQRELQTKSIEDLKNQQSIQDRFAQALEKLQELFVALSPAILDIGNALIPILSGIGKFMKIIEPIMGLLGGAAAGAAVGAAFGGVGAIPGAIIGGLGGGATDIYRGVGDIISPSKGKTTISTKEGGLFELSDNDDVIAAPGLASYMDSKSNTITPSTGLTSTSSPSPTISDSKIDSLINEIRNMNKRPIEVVSTITMDGRVIAEQIGRNNNDTLGQSLNVSAYNI